MRALLVVGVLALASVALQVSHGDPGVLRSASVRVANAALRTMRRVR